MSLKNLRTFVTVAETGSFSAAAERLFLTQSAVSMQIKALEEEWGVTLFDRKLRPPVLNRRGWMLVDPARALVDQYDRLKATAGTATAELVGSVRVGVVPSAATLLLPEVMVRLRRAHPGLTVLAESGLSQELMFKVSQGRLDAAVVTGPDSAEVGIVARLVRREELKLFAHPDLVLPDARDMLATRPFIRFSSTIGIGRIVDEALRARGITKLNAIMELDSFEAILEMVQLKLGIAILPEHSTSRRLTGKLSQLSLDPPITRNLTLVAKKERLEFPAIGVLHQTFQAVASQSPGV